MDLKILDIEQIRTEEPKLKETKHPFVEIPLRFKEKTISVIIKKCNFKIFKNENRFSLAINLDQSPPEIKKKFQEIEEQIRKLAMENKAAVAKINPKFGKWTSDNFILIKTDRSEMEKVWGKLWTDNQGKISAQFLTFGEGEVGKRKPTNFNPHVHIGEKLTGHIELRIARIFCGSCQSITCSIISAFVTNFHGSVSVFDKYEDIKKDD